MTRSVLVSTMAALLLFAPATAPAGNNLHLIPAKGVHYGIVKRSGGTIKVTLERSREGYFIDLNDSVLTVEFRDPVTDGGPPVLDKPGGSPFSEVFPNGAYMFSDLGHDLLSSRGCLQVAAPGGGWDGSRVLCDPASVERILVKPYKGNDLISVESTITIPVDVRCHRTQSACGSNCLLPGAAMCCDTVSGCYTSVGGDCSVDCP